MQKRLFPIEPRRMSALVKSFVVVSFDLSPPHFPLLSLKRKLANFSLLVLIYY